MKDNKYKTAGALLVTLSDRVQIDVTKIKKDCLDI